MKRRIDGFTHGVGEVSLQKPRLEKNMALDIDRISPGAAAYYPACADHVMKSIFTLHGALAALVAFGLVACASQDYTEEPASNVADTSKVASSIPADESCGPGHAWVEANSDRLPAEYDEFVLYSMAYRRAIFSELTPEQKSRLWREHFDRYLASHPHLTAEQVEAIQQAIALASPATYAAQAGGEEGAGEAFNQLKRDVVAAFGKDESRLLFATLGPVESRYADSNTMAVIWCNCSIYDDWCWGSCIKTSPSSCVIKPGCGFLGFSTCNGQCY
jgi:hypothetical protein